MQDEEKESAKDPQRNMLSTDFQRTCRNIITKNNKKETHKPTSKVQDRLRENEPHCGTVCGELSRGSSSS